MEKKWDCSNSNCRTYVILITEIYVAKTAKDDLGSYSSRYCRHILISYVENIGMTIGLLPIASTTTFIGYGGSSY
ncbi:MAG: hypothetical protein ACLUD1_01290 [Clostridia bacterium]